MTINPKKIARMERSIQRQMRGLTFEDMKVAADMHIRGEAPSNNWNSDADVIRERRAWTVLATINRFPGKQYRGVSVESVSVLPKGVKPTERFRFADDMISP